MDGVKVDNAYICFILQFRSRVVHQGGFAMPRVIGTVYETLDNRNVPLSKAQHVAARSFDSIYRKALANIAKLGAIDVFIGTNKRQLTNTDLMAVLRDCKKRLDQKQILGPSDYGFLVFQLKRIGTRKKRITISLHSLLRLRKIAYPKNKSTKT